MMISPIMTAATIPKVAAVMAKVRISSYPNWLKACPMAAAVPCPPQ